MRILAIIFIFFLCNQTFAQQLKNDSKHTLSNSLETQNTKDSFTLKHNLKSTISFLEINDSQNINLFLDTGKRATRTFAFSKPQEINLSKELLKITHRFPGDGSNLVLSPKGLLVP